MMRLLRRIVDPIRAKYLKWRARRNGDDGRNIYPLY